MESGESSEDSYDSADLALYDLKDMSRRVELEPNEDEWSESPDEEVILGVVEEAQLGTSGQQDAQLGATGQQDMEVEETPAQMEE